MNLLSDEDVYAIKKISAYAFDYFLLIASFWAALRCEHADSRSATELWWGMLSIFFFCWSFARKAIRMDLRMDNR